VSGLSCVYLTCVVLRCSVLQCVAVCCSVCGLSCVYLTQLWDESGRKVFQNSVTMEATMVKPPLLARLEQLQVLSVCRLIYMRDMTHLCWRRAATSLGTPRAVTGSGVVCDSTHLYV